MRTYKGVVFLYHLPIYYNCHFFRIFVFGFIQNSVFWQVGYDVVIDFLGTNWIFIYDKSLRVQAVAYVYKLACTFSKRSSIAEYNFCTNGECFIQFSEGRCRIWTTVLNKGHEEDFASRMKDSRLVTREVLLDCCCYFWNFKQPLQFTG